MNKPAKVFHPSSLKAFTFSIAVSSPYFLGAFGFVHVEFCFLHPGFQLLVCFFSTFDAAFSKPTRIEDVASLRFRAGSFAISGLLANARLPHSESLSVSSDSDICKLELVESMGPAASVSIPSQSEAKRESVVSSAMGVLVSS